MPLWRQGSCRRAPALAEQLYGLLAVVNDVVDGDDLTGERLVGLGLTDGFHPRVLELAEYFLCLKQVPLSARQNDRPYNVGGAEFHHYRDARRIAGCRGVGGSSRQREVRSVAVGRIRRSSRWLSFGHGVASRSNSR